ncbi:MAG: hypothetical protein JWN02_1665 [Acidobacteria bacterium]|nr:hypothetical protein [Acidobacteriota bacterium]
MSKIVSAEYDEKEQSLRLAEPLEGVRDHERVDLTIRQTAQRTERREGWTERPWLALEGGLSREAGESLARAVDEMFGDDE